MDKFKWLPGRANDSGYQKMLLFQSTRFKIDCYLLKYPEGSFLGWHIDEPPDGRGRHYRFNVVLKRAAEGGWEQFQSIIPPIINIGRICLFRPDLTVHRVAKVIKGNRYVLSIGWLRGWKV